MPTQRAVAAAKTVARAVADWLPPARPAQGEWIQAYSGKKRRKYQQAQQSLAENPITRNDAGIMAFIKPEKIEDDTRDPRVIQARGARYNYELGNYLKPIEHALYNIKGTRNLRNWLPPTRCIAKGLCMRKRALLLKKKWDRFTDPICYSIDASRFDAHVTTMLEVEHLVYKRFYKDPHLDKLLAWQLLNKCRTATGIRYSCYAGRMSGDMNTALGNCLISIIIAASIMRELKIRKWDMLCDGDDVLLFFERSQAPSNIARHYLDYGFVIKTEVARTLFEIPFCQSHVVETVEGLKMVQIPDRVLSRALAGTKHWHEEKFRSKYLALIGYCELALNMGVPVLQEFALMVLSWGSELPPKPAFSGHVIKALREEKDHRIIQPLPISIDARATFTEAFGIELEEQLALESQFRAQRFRYGSEKKATTFWQVARPAKACGSARRPPAEPPIPQQVKQKESCLQRSDEPRSRTSHHRVVRPLHSLSKLISFPGTS